jgi:2-keto-4-pentenoate hydratase/2-oxohepta-3-ene-1,7-dioic acid hydratase in catechol pathway
MRMATLNGRSVLLRGNRAHDIATLSGHRFGPEPARVFEQWDAFSDWAGGQRLPVDGGVEISERALDPPSPAPRQVFAIGLNYAEHVREAGVAAPSGAPVPPTFTKFQASLSGPYSDLTLPSEYVDWEVELVVVIGMTAHHVGVDDTWSYVAGLTVGQDYSEREVQQSGPLPQFSMGKSFPQFGPTGPWLVTVDEFDNRDDLELECTINGETVQKARTSAMITPVPQLIQQLSAVCPLFPGDLIFTGTPSGVGMARTPPRYLKPGDVVVSRIENIGEIRQHCVV